MPRLSLLLSVVALVLLGLVALYPNVGTEAQEGTPTPEGFEVAPGIIRYALAIAEGQEEPSLYRLTFAPDSILAGEGADDPSISLLFVEAGSLTVTVDGPVAITRGDGAGTPEIVETGTEFTADAGDYLVIPPLAEGEYRNDGQEEVSLVAAAIIPSAMGTPAAGTPAA
ncbi:MAG: hypothetical protein M3450_12700 [Actinomycetota bacterium]|nr:hypothetical protein [Actinomycetota bacterium]MDQ3693037.1 hypothetical protein [Chloroflexota bacterium]